MKSLKILKKALTLIMATFTLTYCFAGCSSNEATIIKKPIDSCAVSAGYNHTVGLRKNGTVAVAGADRYGECNLNKWNMLKAKDIKSQPFK